MKMYSLDFVRLDLVTGFSSRVTVTGAGAPDYVTDQVSPMRLESGDSEG